MDKDPEVERTVAAVQAPDQGSLRAELGQPGRDGKTVETVRTYQTCHVARASMTK